MQRIPSLDGVRALSILLVVLGHLAKRGHAPGAFWENYSITGVRIFFVLSGYLITQILLTEHRLTSAINLKKFYLRRALRIFPAAFVFMALVSAFYWKQFSWYHIAAAFLYLANFDISKPWFFAHLWSLGVEEQFYFLWPGILKRWHKHAVSIVIAVIVLAPFNDAIVQYFRLSWGHFMPDALATGCLLALLLQRLPRVPGYAAVLMLLPAVLVPLFPETSAMRTLFMLFILRPILFFAIAGLILRVMQTPPVFLNLATVCWLGRISYSLYLWQQPFCFAPTLRSGYLSFVALACACVSYYCVERPMLRLRDKQKENGHPKELAKVLQPSTSAA
jgi:peptidoglycan/LPS O-acetylase OafA/YrhL